MKKLYFIFISILLLSCDDNQGFMGWHNGVDVNGIEKDYRIVVIDSYKLPNGL